MLFIKAINQIMPIQLQLLTFPSPAHNTLPDESNASDSVDPAVLLLPP